ncbi:hypothetical protein OE88DRAFT_1655880 [Heliocybe sulcata]|uniref:DRBM domain-containing protein n=1 Tax=Heliocybe sulcata TaxID=5364 RepID=A0A5C3NCF2_9AGAM|nr:hypothetical protein OE88DRAFT_1655880 [Heliocybe sulcata]
MDCVTLKNEWSCTVLSGRRIDCEPRGPNETMPGQNEQNHHRMALNNWLQGHPRFGKVTWAQSQGGLQHDPVWSATAYVRGIEYGKGMGTTLGEAKEKAAYAALAALKTSP